MRQEAATEGDGDLEDPRRSSVDWVGRHRGPMNHDRAVNPALEAKGDPIVWLL